MRTTLALTLVTVALAAGCFDPDADPTPTSTTTDGVTIRISTPEHLAGDYASASGVKLSFDSARSGDVLYLDVRDGAGHVLVHADTEAMDYVFSYLDGKATMRVAKDWVERVRAEEDGGPASQEDAMRWTGDPSVLDEMLLYPEVAALPWLSRTLGGMGYTGADFPASLALHKIARQSADALGIELPPLAEANAEEVGYCSRPTANECYGMCGPGCSCWSWVCGDCCYHGGCAKHDTWCRQGQWYYCYNISAVIALFGC